MCSFEMRDMRTAPELLQALDELATEFSAVAVDTAVALVVARQLPQTWAAKQTEWHATFIFAAPFDGPDRLDELNRALAAGGIPIGHVMQTRDRITAKANHYRCMAQRLPEICRA